MDEVERLILAFRAHGASSAVAWKLDALLDLGRQADSRVLRFLLEVLADRHELIEVRVDVLKRVRNMRAPANERPRVAEVIQHTLAENVNAELCLCSALALGEFVDLPAVMDVLGELALESSESFDLRYAAFTSIERAGPTPAARAVLERLTHDEMLGRSAAGLLRAWRTP